MVASADKNAEKILELEKCLSSTNANISIIDGRTQDILVIVRELKADLSKATSASHDLAIKNAENAVSWSSYKRDRERLEREDEELSRKIAEGEKGLEEKILTVERLAQSNRLALAKSAVVAGGGAGALSYVVIELVKLISSKL